MHNSNNSNGVVLTPSLPQTLHGVDLFVEFEEQPSKLAEMLLQYADPNYTITTISNRGTQVWPTGSVFTNCINQYRVRFECNEGVSTTPFELFELCKQVSTVVRICSVEMLLMIDGVRGYSLAQGQ